MIMRVFFYLRRLESQTETPTCKPLKLNVCGLDAIRVENGPELCKTPPA